VLCVTPKPQEVIVRLRELRVSYVTRSEPSAPTTPTVVVKPSDAAALFAPLLESQAVEVFGLLCLTTKHRLLCYHDLARGTLDTATVQPRELFTVALLAHAACVVVGHNHPSGDPTPSEHDGELTGRLTAAGRLIGIDVLDHIIVGDEGQYYSFKEAGRL
jgi:DNA repair protein RadC